MIVHYILRDQIRGELDHLEQGSMTIMECEAYFHAFCRYSYAKIPIDSKNILKFIKGSNFSLQLAKTKVVVYGASF